MKLWKYLCCFRPLSGSKVSERLGWAPSRGVSHVFVPSRGVRYLNEYEVYIEAEGKEFSSPLGEQGI